VNSFFDPEEDMTGYVKKMRGIDAT